MSLEIHGVQSIANGQFCTDCGTYIGEPTDSPRQCGGCTAQQAEVAALLYEADDKSYWMGKSRADLTAAARCFALFGADDNGLIVDPRTGHIHNPTEAV